MRKRRRRLKCERAAKCASRDDGARAADRAGRRRPTCAGSAASRAIPRSPIGDRDDAEALSPARERASHPEVEVGRFLTEVAGFRTRRRSRRSPSTSRATARRRRSPLLQQFVRNQGDAWRWTLNRSTRELDTLACCPSVRRRRSRTTRRLPALRAACSAGASGEMHRRLRDADRRPGLRGRAADRRRMSRRSRRRREPRRTAPSRRSSALTPDLQAQRRRASHEAPAAPQVPSTRLIAARSRADRRDQDARPWRLTISARS